MNRNFNRLVPLLPFAWILGATPGHAAEEHSSFDPPLISVPEPLPYIQTNCSKCREVNLEIVTTPTGTSQGVLTLIYFDETQGELVGSLELKLLLASGTEAVVVVEDVRLINGEEARWVLDESPDAWRWDEVDSANLELVAG